jgi:hypothetical protein
VVAMYMNVDVHLSRTEIVLFGRFSGNGSLLKATCCV